MMVIKINMLILLKVEYGNVAKLVCVVRPVIRYVSLEAINSCGT